MDTNINYHTYNGNIPTGNLNYGQAADIAKQLGMDQASRNFNFIQNGNIYRLADNGQGGGGVISQIDTVGNRQAAQAKLDYQAQAGSAVTGLQAQQGSLAGQYADLLKTVKGEYEPLINQTTQTAGAALSARGLTPDSQLFQQQTQGALAPIYGQEAQNAQQIGAGSISDIQALAQQIAQIQQGNAQFGATLPLQYGQLSLQQQALPSQLAVNAAQANQANSLAKASSFLPVSQGVSFYNTGNNSAINMAQLLAKSMGYNLTP